MTAGDSAAHPRLRSRPDCLPASQRTSGPHRESFRGTVAPKHGQNLTLALRELEQFWSQAG